ncbi:hypothetical protein Aph02nite_81260 [Actinoplanes philippinensis]|nr:hypothetical protein Aph02nite_81260 [Actinoplanes philippinensis]
MRSGTRRRGCLEAGGGAVGNDAVAVAWRVVPGRRCRKGPPRPGGRGAAGRRGGRRVVAGDCVVRRGGVAVPLKKKESGSAQATGTGGAGAELATWAGSAGHGRERTKTAPCGSLGW